MLALMITRTRSIAKSFDLGSSFVMEQKFHETNLLQKTFIDKYFAASFHFLDFVLSFFFLLHFFWVFATLFLLSRKFYSREANEDIIIE